MEDLSGFIREDFGVTEETFLDALLKSGNARGYILGAVTELLLKREIEKLGFEVERIREKWEGDKLHHGDFYVRRPGGRWFVLESKGVKSNAEKWHKLRKVPTDPEELRRWLDRKRSGEFHDWWKAVPADRRERILKSGRLNEGRMIETHFVSGTAGKSGRKIATPRKSEFHVVALDLFLRTGKHEFIFATSDALEPAEKDPEHLKQNYLVDILVPGVDERPVLPPAWSWDFKSLFAGLKDPVREEDRQVDTRRPGAREEGIDVD